jgi:hypothetical protein
VIRHSIWSVATLLLSKQRPRPYPGQWCMPGVAPPSAELDCEETSECVLTCGVWYWVIFGLHPKCAALDCTRVAVENDALQMPYVNHQGASSRYLDRSRYRCLVFALALKIDQLSGLMTTHALTPLCPM